VEIEEMGAGAQTMSVVKGSYSGMLMFGMLGNLVGLAAMSPAVIAVGLFMGRKALRDEKDRKLTGRRQEAKTAVRKYVDEVSFTIGRDSREALRQVHRQLRDVYSERAEQLHRSTTEALQRTQQAVNSSESERQRRLRDVEAELQRILGLRARIVALAPDLAGEGR
jgi:hypothetical protein